LAGPDEGEGRAPRDGDEGLSPLASAYQKAAPYLGASSSLVAGVGGFAFAGWWLDRKVGNRTPWFFILGAVIGMVGGFISFFRIVLGLNTRKGPRA
jgi:F0F1-type ATP synthase assembly protein I